MRVSIIENRGEDREQEVIVDVGTVTKLKDYRTWGDCLKIDDMIFKTGKRTDELYLFMLKNGYLDMSQYEIYRRGI